MNETKYWDDLAVVTGTLKGLSYGLQLTPKLAEQYSVAYRNVACKLIKCAELEEKEQEEKSMIVKYCMTYPDGRKEYDSIKNPTLDKVMSLAINCKKTGIAFNITKFEKEE